MICQKFNYDHLERNNVDGERLYCLPDGTKVPSVTTILNVTSTSEKKDALKRWKDRVGVKKAEEIVKDASSRGTRMHTYLEKYIRDGAMPDRGSNPYSWASHAMADTIIKSGLNKVDEFWGVEVPLYFPKVYAGTSDCIGVHEKQESIMDFKQTNKPKRREWIDDYFIQLAAYAEAHNEVHGTQINKGVILMCVKPEQTEQAVITKAPEYQEFVLKGAEFEHYRREWWRRVEQYYMLNT
jgi:hypothetical protein